MMIAYIITGKEERDWYGDGRYIMPHDATHFSVHPSVTVFPEALFKCHRNIVELICHDDVWRIGDETFYGCFRLKRMIMRGVEVVGISAFHWCEALEYVECPKLEIIGVYAFDNCKSLSNINLTSAKIVGDCAFGRCEALTEAKFGKELQSVGWGAFRCCKSLERITVPLKNGLITDDEVFTGCRNLKRVDLVEGEVLHETVAGLLFQKWGDDMNAEIDSINQSLPNARAGEYDINYISRRDDGEKAIKIREWIERVLSKIIDYKAKHRRILKAASSALQLALPNDIVKNNVLSFLELPLHTFDGENDEQDDDSNDESADASFVFDEGGNEDEEDDGGGDKRRKTAYDHEERLESSAH